MRLIDWMFEHPWMTFFILYELASSIGKWFNNKDEE